MDLIAYLLGRLMMLCSKINDNYPLILVEFTFLTKIILLPISIWAQFNSIKIVKMTSQLYDLKMNYFGDRDTINEKIAQLYKKENYHPFLGIIPLVAQLILLMGVIDAVKSPELSGFTHEKMIDHGIDYTAIASEQGGWYILFPILAALSALLMCWTQNRSQVLQAQQNAWNRYGILILSTAISLYLGFYVSCAVASYWILSNLFSILQMYLLNAVINPEKYIDYELLKTKAQEYERMSSTDLGLTREQKKRQNADYKRFFSIANKHIVFYSEKSGFYKYYRRLIEWLLSHSNIVIHYVTSDPDDIVFELARTQERIRPYFIGPKKLITLFMKMDARIVVMTIPDLENYYLKRSYVDKGVEYIYTDHGMTSFNLTFRKKALDHFDTVFCPTKQDVLEIRAHEKLYALPEKTLVETGYGNLEDIAEEYEAFRQTAAENEKSTVLIAPSYQTDNILDSCLENVIEALTALDCLCIIRPHPQYIRRKPQKWEQIVQKYQAHDHVVLESDFSANTTIYKADLVVTDWSSIGFEYAFSTLHPCLFLDTPMKIINPDYQEIPVVPLDILLRNVVGKSVKPEDTDAIREAAAYLIGHSEEYKTIIQDAREEHIYHFMKSAEVGGKYILSRLKAKRSNEV